MGTLNIPGLGAFTVDDSFGKLSREEQQNIVSELRESYAAKNVASDIQRNAGAGKQTHERDQQSPHVRPDPRQQFAERTR